MRRAAKLTLRYATTRKRETIAHLLTAYRGAVNYYIRSLWREPGRLDGMTLARLPAEHTRLTARYKAQALRQALAIVAATQKSAKTLGVFASRPVFRGSAILDAKFVSLEPGQGSFDLVVRLSTLRRGQRITIPTRRTVVLNQWLARPDSRLIQGCALSERGIVVWIDIPDRPTRTEGQVLGVDVGITKLLVTSTGVVLGADFRAIRDKVRRRRPGSNGQRRARIERDQFINRIVRQLPWPELQAIGYEDLIGLKRGKAKSRGKAFRKAAAPWTYRRVRQRIEMLAQENRVRPVVVDPSGTSRCCPRCSTVDRRNRVGERFRCIGCDYMADADYVGALNVLSRTHAALGRVVSPRR